MLIAQNRKKKCTCLWFIPLHGWIRVQRRKWTSSSPTSSKWIIIWAGQLGSPTSDSVFLFSPLEQQLSLWSGEAAEFCLTPAWFSNDLFFPIATESYRKQRQPGRRSRLSGITINHAPNSSVGNLQQMVRHCPPAAAIIRRQTAAVFGIQPLLHRVDDASIAANRAEAAVAAAPTAAFHTFTGRSRSNLHTMPLIFFSFFSFFISLAKAMISC